MATPDDFVPDYKSMTVQQLLRGALNAAGIDALASTPDHELMERLDGLPHIVELQRRAGEDAVAKGGASLQFTVTMNGGHEIRVHLDYPKDQGLSALQALHQLDKHANSMLYELYNLGDRSVREAMDSAGVQFADPDEDDDEDWED